MTTPIVALIELKLLSSSSQGDTSSCQSFLCKPQSTGWPLTPAQEVKSPLLTPLHNRDAKVHLRPFFLYFYFFVSSNLFKLVRCWLYIHHTTAKKVSHELFAVLTKTSVQLYNQSLPPPCGHYDEAHRNWVGLFRFSTMCNFLCTLLFKINIFIHKYVLNGVQIPLPIIWLILFNEEFIIFMRR